MRLALQSQKIGGVAVIRCHGRLVVGEEVSALQTEIEKHSLETKKYVLQLGEVSYVDSGGLGALVRLVGTLRADHGDVRLCQVSPFVQNVLQATNLLGVFPTYSTEQEALASFSERAGPRKDDAWSANTKVLCIDTSSDLLAYLTAVLKRAGFEVKTTRYLADASTLLTATKPRVVICGPGVQSTTPAFEKFRRLDTRAQFLFLPADFHSSDASDAGLDLINRLQSLLQSSAKV
jgi:anti-sigma B factor antagonist